MTARRPLLVLAALVGALAGTGTLAVAAFTESATNSGSTFNAAANFTPVLESVPDVLGAPREDAVLSVNQADYLASLPPTARTYQWQRCNTGTGVCADIVGQTGTTYTVTAADATSTIRVVATGVRGAAPSIATSSDQTIVAQTTNSGLNTVPTLNGAVGPVVSDTTPNVGDALTATSGTWTSDNGSYTYQWYRCNATGTACATSGVASGTSAYAVTVADRGFRLRVRVTARSLLSAAVTNSATTADTAIVP